MLERSERLVKFLCVIFAVLLVWRLARGLSHLDPVGRVNLPAVPTWSPPPPPTNAPAGGPGGPPGPGGAPMMMGRRGGMGGPGGMGPSLPPELQGKVDRIVQSELLGMVMRPPPMALLGIAGQDILLRAPNGQTGLLREGGEMGGVQLLRIGTNRVLVKENGQERELMIFEGLGGESLATEGKKVAP